MLTDGWTDGQTLHHDNSRQMNRQMDSIIAYSSCFASGGIKLQKRYVQWHELPYLISAQSTDHSLLSSLLWKCAHLLHAVY